MTYKTVKINLFSEGCDKTFEICVNNGVLYLLSKAGIDIFKLLSGEDVTYDIVVDALAVLLGDQGVTTETLLDQPPRAVNNILECFMALVKIYQEDMSEGPETKEGGPEAGN